MTICHPGSPSRTLELHSAALQGMAILAQTHIGDQHTVRVEDPLVLGGPRLPMERRRRAMSVEESRWPIETLI